jgi:Holliday junction resolvase RusA-like endonuclease
MIVFDFDVHPQSWQRAGTSTGHFYTQKATREFEHEVKMLMRSQMDGEPSTTGCTVSLVLSFYTTNKKRWGTPKTTRSDIDNLLKGIFDAGNGIVWKDDSLIWHLTDVQKVWADHAHIHMEVTVEEAKPALLVSRKVIAASDLMFKKLDAKIAKSPKLKKIYEKAKKDAENACANDTVSAEEYLRGVEQ